MNNQTTRAPENIRRSRRRRRRRRRNPLPLILTVIVTVFALWKLTTEVADKIQSKQYLEELVSQVVEENTQASEPEETTSQEPEPIEIAPIQVDFQELMLYYPDITGWLYCPNTSINYPVVQTDNNQYYMHRLPDGKESAGGSLFVDCTNTWGFTDANSVIYGHDMKDGTMFGYLHNFDSQTYYENHPVFYLLTPVGNYRVDVVCTAVVPSDSWIYEKQMDTQKLQTWIKQIRQTSLIQPTVEISDDMEHFLTLSTCSYEYENARFVVIGALKKIY